MKIENSKPKLDNINLHTLPLLKKAIFLLLFPALIILINPVSAQTGDTTPPTTSHTLNPADPDGENDWYVSPVNVTLSADDLDSGVASIFWKIDDDPWKEKTFPPTLNLLQNPSFESGSGSTIDNWEGSGTAGATFLHDGTEHYDGGYSAKITSVTSGWSGWNNRNSYAVVNPWDNMSASVWVKTENVLGNGVYFKVYARTPSGDVCIANCTGTGITGTTGWSRLFLTPTVTASDAYGVYLDIGIEGTGTVWIDYATLKKISTDTSVNFTISRNGEFDLQYYSVDHIGNEELPHHTIPLKIDTKAPGNWRDFEIEQAGNDHTLIARIWVSDESSGLQTATDKFQYSIDDGITWGYFEDLLRCDSQWHMDGWRDLSSSFAPGTNEVLLQTPAIDYCSSDWHHCKIIRFYIKDMAGNESYKDICINGAWTQTSGRGDVYAATGINMSAAGAGDNTDGLIISGGDIVGFTSSQGWSIPNYSPTLTKPSYTEWQDRLSSPTAIDHLPTENGIYVVNGGFTIARTTIPDNLANAAFGAVIFVNGDLRINEDYSLGDEGALAFIVNGDVDVDKQVNNIAGIFLAEGKFDTAYNGGSNLETLNINGSVLAESIALNRSLRQHENVSSPAEIFIYEPKYLGLMTNLLNEGQRAIRWFEIGS